MVVGKMDCWQRCTVSAGGSLRVPDKVSGTLWIFLNLWRLLFTSYNKRSTQYRCGAIGAVVSIDHGKRLAMGVRFLPMPSHLYSVHSSNVRRH